MKTRSVYRISKPWLLIILVLVLLPCVVTAKDTATLDEELGEAAARGDLEQVKRLLDKGANVIAHNREGATPLMRAAEKGHLDVVKLLLRKGAPVNGKSSDNVTPLMYAARGGNLKAVKLLLDKGADVNSETGFFRTALMDDEIGRASCRERV